VEMVVFRGVIVWFFVVNSWFLRGGSCG